MGLKSWFSEKYHSFKKSLAKKTQKFLEDVKEKTKEIALKLFILAIIILVLWLLFLFLKPHLIAFLERHPWLNRIYEHIIYQITRKTYLGLLYASFFGAIFFITVPLEIIILYYISLGKSIYFIGIITLIGGVFGLFMNYLIGILFGEKAMKFMLKDSYTKMKGWVDRFGGFFLVIGSALPSPIEVACLVFGATRYSIKKFFIYNAIGRVMKIIALYFLADWLLKIAIPYIQNLF